MRIQWRKEWTTPAVVGVSSFAAGVAAGVLGYRIKVDREIDKGLQTMSDLIQNGKRIGTIDRLEMTEDGVMATGTITDESVIRNISPAHRRTGLEYIDQNPIKKGLVDDFTEGLRRQNTAETPSVDIPSSDELTAEEVFEEITPQPVINNVFEGDPNWNQEEEEAERTTDAPYILHQEEFFRNDKGYRQMTLTWYDGDKILTDENDVPVYDTSVVGRLEFGRGANSPDTVYVRNDQNKAEYEVIRVPASYQVEVMGLEAEEEADKDELRHSQRITRFRMD